ncbi:MAG: hypothetical protein HRJ53_28115 [Acidobacteria bacterium Pan2503]|uniref:Uncharacterized protein n=1 Tax=Candidatus Acidiferrum panamense TaxID=2741543 RepID=A0A7V8NWQ3_9BACT|nr:hypothetical protein [Candidatus Acidoferrum panamensis]
MQAQLAALQAEAAKLAAENARLKLAQRSKLSMKIGDKGALSVYGMGRWPVTLYRSQWETLLAADNVQLILDYIEANADRLAVKGE